MSQPRYRIQAWDNTGFGFGPGDLIAEFQLGKNLGYADYLNDVPESFFTLSQDDPKVALLAPWRDKAHLKIYRDSDLVWAGILGEWDANERDVIIYGYGYLALFYLLVTDWNVAYTTAQINTIVEDAFDYVATTLTDSPAEWIAKGTIEAPVTTSGGSTAISLPSYRMFWKRALFLFREMAALAVGNTTNTPVFEVTPTGTFNFWKNLGQDRDITWEYGDSRVSGFNENVVPILKRTEVLAAGNNPNDALLRSDVEDSTLRAAIGRRMEPMFFSWVRDGTELDRASNFRLSMLKRDVVDLMLQFHPGSVIPPGATGAGFVNGDRVNVKVARGITDVDGQYLVRGYQTLVIRGSERVNVLLDERSGS